MHKIPNWTKSLNKLLIPILEKSEKNLVSAINILKNQCLIFENDILPS